MPQNNAAEFTRCSICRASSPTFCAILFTLGLMFGQGVRWSFAHRGQTQKRHAANRRPKDCRVFIAGDGCIDWATYEENRRMRRRNSVTWEADESLSAIRAGQGMLVGLLRCGHCSRKLHVRYWGGTGANVRYLCKGDYDDGGQYCVGFGGAMVDRRLMKSHFKVISPFAWKPV